MGKYEVKTSQLFIFTRGWSKKLSFISETKLKTSYAFYNYIHIQKFEANRQVYLLKKKNRGSS